MRWRLPLSDTLFLREPLFGSLNRRARPLKNFAVRVCIPPLFDGVIGSGLVMIAAGRVVNCRWPREIMEQVVRPAQ
jgi:hypothetical protein